MSNTTGIPTALDTLRALSYALNRVKKEKCNDPDIQAKFKNGIKWNSYPAETSFDCPPGLENCDKGHCDIATEELCKEMSSPIYDSNGVAIPEEKRKSESIKRAGGVPLAFQNNRCVYSNFLLQKYCEVPASRGYQLDDKGNIIGIDTERGVTDVPPFKYDEKLSACFVTPDYCNAMQTDYKEGNPNNMLSEPPTCKETKAAEILSYFGVTNTLFKYFRIIGKGCKKVSKIVDDKAIKTKKMVSPDYGGKGVNLYLLEWKDDMISTIPPNIGFIYSELKQSPNYRDNLIKEKDGYYYMDLTIDEVKKLETEKKPEDINYHKRIFYTYVGNNEIIKLLAENVLKT